MKLGLFIVDTHVHAQRHAAGAALKGSTDYGDLGRAIQQVDAYDNSARLLYHMETYGVDMCVLEPAFGMSNEINAELVKKYPDKFVANCQAGTKHTRDRVEAGEIEWDIKYVLEELDGLLKTGNYVGIGEGIPAGRTITIRDGYPVYNDELTLMREMMMICDLARSYNVPIRYHCGTNVGYEGHYHSHPWNFNPLWAHDLAMMFPEVPLIMEHGGIEGWWWERLYEECLAVAASHKNVYLETGRYWTELYYKALADRNIGPEKLIWGTDWGASLPVQTNLGNKYLPPTYTEQVRKDGIVRHQVDIWGWSLKQLLKLDISQDDLNLILGGNAVRIYKLRTPGGLSRMFKLVE
ncbi:MAG: amidohydrolase family protein [Chloroflexi bacterium]|nr:amidohydrolase family protein [Chloroflexota bacterium]